MGRRLVYEELRSVAIAATYTALGTPLDHAGTIVKVINDTNGGVTVSVDGVNDHDYMPANSFFLYDCTANSVNTTDGIFVEKGRQYYVKGSGAGTVYLIVQHIKGA